MPEPQPAVLITRPEPGASSTARRVRAMGLRPVVAPVLSIERLPAELPDPAALAAILVTSGNALASIPPPWRGASVLAVGDATARQARAAGFAAVESADGDAEALASLAARRLSPAGPPLLLLSGAGQGGPLAEALRARGFAVIRREVYAARPVAFIPAATRVALAGGELRAALFFSAETARVFVDLVEAAGLGDRAASVEALAIGSAAAVALKALPWHAIQIAARPTQDEMLALLR